MSWSLCISRLCGRPKMNYDCWFQSVHGQLESACSDSIVGYGLASKEIRILYCIATLVQNLQGSERRTNWSDNFYGRGGGSAKNVKAHKAHQRMTASHRQYILNRIKIQTFSFRRIYTVLCILTKAHIRRCTIIVLINLLAQPEGSHWVACTAAHCRM